MKRLVMLTLIVAGVLAINACEEQEFAKSSDNSRVDLVDDRPGNDVPIEE